MFEHYLYVSSATRTFRYHFEDLVHSAIARMLACAPDMLALDIGSKDGCLLSYLAATGLSGGRGPCEEYCR